MQDFSGAFRAASLALPAIFLASCSEQQELTKERSEPVAYSFSAAVNDASTSYPIVRILVLDKAKGKVQVRCVIARALLHAIEIEHDIKPLYDGPGNAREIALSTPVELFSFKKPAALAALNVDWFEPSRSERACAAIASGLPAKIGDYAPWLYVGDGKGGLVKAE
ncbi:MAG: hypothetical protein ACKOUT_11035 [Novosphingobium sp.]